MGEPLHHHCDKSPTCNVHGSSAHKTITYVPNSLKMAIGADNASTVVSGQIQVSLSVPFDARGCKREVFCFCKTVCRDATMAESFTMAITITTPCKICPMPPAVTPAGTTVVAKVIGTPKVNFYGESDTSPSLMPVRHVLDACVRVRVCVTECACVAS